MTMVEVGEIVLVVLALLGWATSLDVRGLSGRNPTIRSLAERRRVSYAITFEVTILVALIISARWFGVSLGRDVNTVVFLVALGAPSLVNAMWLWPTIKRLLGRTREVKG